MVEKQPAYFQTWNKVSKVRRWPIVGPWLYLAIQWLCGKIAGHEASKTEWGYGGGDMADVWCRWCNHQWQVPKSVIQFRNKDTAHLIQDVGKEFDA